MRIPVIRGTIDRRILVNFRIDAEVAARLLPPPFRPWLVNGFAIGGICLIRLRGIRPRLFPLPCGLGSENAAHRFAVEWDSRGQTRRGVYIPRRDTSSRLNAWAGGRLFPGIHHRAAFAVHESATQFSVEVRSGDGAMCVSVAGSVTDLWPSSSVFDDLEAASQFFAAGSLGYSHTNDSHRWDGLELRCNTWQMQPLAMERAQSSYFDDEAIFPRGSATFDCALLMRGIAHTWHAQPALCCDAVTADSFAATAGEALRG